MNIDTIKSKHLTELKYDYNTRFLKKKKIYVKMKRLKKFF